ncbi:hypothetical protein NEF87_001952 [Candidatus Lokiarchaeum ossiferum]|uniref:Uncharacterized protein n=1 Tax=Candidatus Lokiarchaeum ossiferum TaxID=2951803 RepID=A0ABY6HTG3_9ARCH|nr:hypothetical protein NEF87_001952 [Candidatus Lokiarchaeum sp. B-35]
MLVKKRMVRLSIFFLMVSSFYIGTDLLLGGKTSSTAPLSSNDDSFEENDSYDQAYPIEKAQDLEGEDGWYEAILQDEDWYIFDLVEGENVSILILFYEEEIQDYSENVEAACYSADHVTQVGNIDIGPGIIQISMESAPSTGEYFIYLNPNELQSVEYQIIIWPYMEDEYEENDEISSASEIYENYRGYELYLYALDDDWYKVYLEPGWELSGYMWYLSCADISIEFYAPDETTLLNAGIENEEYLFQVEVQFDIPVELIDSAGFYYIHIDLLQGVSLYDLEIDIVGNPLQAPQLYPITPNPSDSGYVQLHWSYDNEASFYTIYRESFEIVDVTSLTPIADFIQNNYYNDLITENGTYFYAITSNAGGESTTPSNSESVDITILPFTERRPILRNIYNDGYGRVEIYWDAIYGADYYLVYQDTIEIIDYSHLTSIALVQPHDEDQTNFYWSGTIEENGTYYYAIVGVQGEDFSIVSNSESVDIAIPPFSERSTRYFNVYTSYTEDGFVEMAWGNVEGAQSYYLYRDTTTNFDISGLVPISILSGTWFDEELTENGTYYYCVVPFNGVDFGIQSAWESVEVNLVPFTERIPQLNPISWHESYYEEVHLNWNSFRDANQYLIYRDTSEITSIAGMEPVGLSEYSSFSDYVSTNGTYYYTILATNGFETSKISNCESVTVNITPFSERIIPYIYVYPRISDTGQIEIEWESLHGATSYAIYRESSEIVDISSLTPVYTTYEETNWRDQISVNGTYWYTVIANNGTVNCTLSAAKSVEVAIIPFSEREMAYIHGYTEQNREWVYLNWNEVYSATIYEIYRSNSTITDISGLNIYDTTTSTDWQDNIPYNGTFYYVVRAYNGSIYTPISACIMIEQIFLPFYELETYFYDVQSYDDGRVHLRWNEMVDTDIYEIYRDTSEITDISEMLPVHISYDRWDTSYDDYVEENGLYYYAVVGNNGTSYSKLSPIRSVYVNIIPFNERMPSLQCDYETSTGEVELGWDVFKEADVYYIYRLDFQPDGIDGLSPIAMTPNNYYEETLTVNDTYYYVVVGYDGNQLSHVSNCQRVSLQILPFSQRKPYLNSIYFEPSDGRVEMYWKQMSGAVGYYIYREQNPITSIEGLEPVGFQIGNGLDTHIWYSDYPEVSNHYYYAVVAYDGTQMSLPSNSREVYMFEYEFGDRKPYFYFENVWNSQGKVSLEIEDVDGAISFFIFRDTSSISSTDGLEPIARIDANPNNWITYLDIVPNNGEYYYAIIANNGTTNSSLSNYRDTFIDGIQDVETPEINNYNKYDSGEVYIEWDYQTSAAEYLIYREMSNITDLDGLTPFARCHSSSFHDYSIATNDSYYYVVVARNGIYTSEMSNCVNITVNMYVVEEAPFLSAVYRSSDYQIYLDWDYVSNANVYYIYRDLTEITDISGKVPISIRTDSTYYYDNKIFEEGIYHYVVVAGNGAGNSSWSNCLNATIEFLPPTTPILASINPSIDLDGEIYLDWDNIPYADGYYIYRCDTEVYNAANLILIGNTGSSSYSDWVSENQIYHYAIVASNELGVSELSNIESVENQRPAIPNHAYVPSGYEWIDTTSNVIMDQYESESYLEIDLPFSFDFYGISYSTVYVCKNGYLTFADSAYKYCGGIYNDFPNSVDNLKYVISPFMEYLYLGTMSTISVTNGSGYCAISWENMEYNEGYSTSFQVILYDDGSIKFQYDYVEDVDSYTTVGLNLGDGIHGEFYLGLTTQTDDFAFMYVPYLENTNPSMTLPNDLSYYSNDVKTYSLSWTITDPDVYQPIYRIMVDGEMIVDDTVWTSGTMINFDVTGWEVGQHLVMIFIEDGFGGIVVDYVWIFVEEIPIILTAGDLFYEEGESQPQILTWTIIDNTYKAPTYNITMDGVVMVENEPWPGNKSISYDVSALAAGNYVIELIVSDGMGNTARDAVIVSVYALSDNSPHITSPEDLTYYAGSTESYILSWTITDATVNNPTYSIEVDGTMVIENESWVSGDTIEFDVSNWEEGIYTVKITVKDGYNGEAIDVVVVTVTGTPDGSPFNLESIPGFNIIYLLGISAIAINILKKRKKYHL